MTTDSQPDEVVLNRSTVREIQLLSDRAFVFVSEEGSDHIRNLIPTTPAAARAFTPGEIVEVVLRRVAEPETIVPAECEHEAAGGWSEFCMACLNRYQPETTAP